MQSTPLELTLWMTGGGVSAAGLAHLGDAAADVDLGGEADDGDAHALLLGRLDAVQDVARVARRQRREEDQHLQPLSSMLRVVPEDIAQNTRRQRRNRASTGSHCTAY